MQISIQILPRRGSNFDVLSLRPAIDQLAGNAFFTGCGVSGGYDRERFITITFIVSSLVDAWEALRTRFYESAMVTPYLADCSIVVCEGKRCWDDYLLLHHFDPDEPLDSVGPTSARI